MSPELLEKVMSCRKLPSLPAIALKVIELTNNDNVPVKAIGETIASDQALSLRVLKTVNSSFYGLRKPCSTINQAIVMLGLSAVKTLALGFSLVSGLAKDKAIGFDYEQYWKRSLLSGVAAKIIAAEAKCGNDEEAFLGGLLQDVGMIALYQALGSEYGDLLKEANGDHRKVARLEIQNYEASHADIGAMLATNWKLPESLISPIKFHERSNAAPPEHSAICHAVALGNICADLMSAVEPAGPLKRLYEKSNELLGLSPGQIDTIIKAVNSGAREIASLLAVPMGPAGNLDAMLHAAKAKLSTLSVPFHPGSGLPGYDDSEVDPQTRLPSELVFKRNLIVAFEQSSATNRPISIALLALENLPALLASHGQETVDAVILESASRMNSVIERHGGLLFRFEPDRFAALLPVVDRATATRCIDAARRTVCDTPLAMTIPGLLPFTLSVAVSAGLVCLDDSTRGTFHEPGDLLGMTKAAVAAASRAGTTTGAIRVHQAKKAA